MTDLRLPRGTYLGFSLACLILTGIACTHQKSPATNLRTLWHTVGRQAAFRPGELFFSTYTERYPHVAIVHCYVDGRKWSHAKERRAISASIQEVRRSFTDAYHANLITAYYFDMDKRDATEMPIEVKHVVFVFQSLSDMDGDSQPDQSYQPIYTGYLFEARDLFDVKADSKTLIDHAYRDENAWKENMDEPVPYRSTEYLIVDHFQDAPGKAKP